jgi:hypothetical protein
VACSSLRTLSARGAKTAFLEPFLHKTINFLRQARDRHEETLRKRLFCRYIKVVASPKHFSGYSIETGPTGAWGAADGNMHWCGQRRFWGHLYAPKKGSISKTGSGQI